MRKLQLDKSIREPRTICQRLNETLPTKPSHSTYAQEINGHANDAGNAMLLQRWRYTVATSWVEGRRQHDLNQRMQMRSATAATSTSRASQRYTSNGK